jgi:hypothetical protein
LGEIQIFFVLDFRSGHFKTQSCFEFTSGTSTSKRKSSGTYCFLHPEHQMKTGLKNETVSMIHKNLFYFGNLGAKVTFFFFKHPMFY